MHQNFISWMYSAETGKKWLNHWLTVALLQWCVWIASASIWCTLRGLATTGKYVKSNQIKSNHFYCHITTAQVPWWVKFLWACSRQCRKTTDNLHMDRQCKKLHWSIYSAPDSAKKNKKKTTTAIYIWTDSAKKQQQFTYGQYILQTVQKTMCKIHIHMSAL